MGLVCTGFEGFGDHAYNPSWDVARSAADRFGGEKDAVAVRLPVEFEFVRDWAVDRAWRKDRAEPPDAVVEFGLGESRATIDLEARAHNVRGCRADEAGRASEERGPLCAGERDRLVSTAPVESLQSELARRFQALDLPGVSVSDDAGDYVCNALYYHTLKWVRSRDTDPSIPILFVHVPLLEPGDARRVGEVFGELLEERLAPEDSSG